ncbi:MAG: phage major capsid protein [Actinomycetota bacterium]
MWGLPVVESEAISAGTALVGDFRKAVLFDRQNFTIVVGTVGDDFIRNIVRILAETRAGFAVLRPKAFCEVDLVVQDKRPCICDGRTPSSVRSLTSISLTIRPSWRPHPRAG